MAWILEVVGGGNDLIWDREPERGPTPASEAHTSALFHARLACAECMADVPVVLTAEHGLLYPNDLVPGPYDPAFARPVAVTVETLREQIRAHRLDEMTAASISVDDPAGRELIAAAFAGTRVELHYKPERTVEEAIAAAEECAARCAE